MDMEFAKVVVENVMNVSMYHCFDFDLCVHWNDKLGDTNNKHLVGDNVCTRCGFDKDNDNWGDINENIWQIFVGRTFAASTRTCVSGTRSSASSPPSRTWWPGVRGASMTRAPIKMKTMMTMMRMMMMMLWMVFPAFELLESSKTTPSENDTGFNLFKPQR